MIDSNKIPPQNLLEVSTQQRPKDKRAAYFPGQQMQEWQRALDPLELAHRINILPKAAALAATAVKSRLCDAPY